MTKKHFIEIAAALRNVRVVMRNDAVLPVCEVMDAVERRLIAVFAAENPRFDVSKFKKAASI